MQTFRVIFYYILSHRRSVIFVSTRWIFGERAHRLEPASFRSHCITIPIKERHEIATCHAACVAPRELRVISSPVEFSDPGLSLTRANFLLSSRISSRELHYDTFPAFFFDPASHPNFRSKISRTSCRNVMRNICWIRIIALQMPFT